MDSRNLLAETVGSPFVDSVQGLMSEEILLNREGMMRRACVQKLVAPVGRKGSMARQSLEGI
jgi:hypothetical protein